MLLDIAPSEMLLTVIVAVVAIGPKDMPRALRTAGRWLGKMRRVSGHFRVGIENMIREAELEEMERKWREQNAAIMQADCDMKAHPEAHEPAALAGPAPYAQPAGEMPAASTGDAVPHSASYTAPEASPATAREAMTRPAEPDDAPVAAPAPTAPSAS